MVRGMAWVHIVICCLYREGIGDVLSVTVIVITPAGSLAGINMLSLSMSWLVVWSKLLWVLFGRSVRILAILLNLWVRCTSSRRPSKLGSAL